MREDSNLNRPYSACGFYSASSLMLVLVELDDDVDELLYVALSVVLVLGSLMLVVVLVSVSSDELLVVLVELLLGSGSLS